MRVRYVLIFDSRIVPDSVIRQFKSKTKILRSELQIINVCSRFQHENNFRIVSVIVKKLKNEQQKFSVIVYKIITKVSTVLRNRITQHCKNFPIRYNLKIIETV